jgi:hypothetical protein
MDELIKLLDYLSSINTGQIADTGKLESLLSACWNKFDGFEIKGLEQKMIDRGDPSGLSMTVTQLNTVSFSTQTY